MIGLTPLLCWLLASSSRRRRNKSSSNRQGPAAFTATQDRPIDAVAKRPTGVVWIDVENVRGRSGFQLSHMDILNQISSWIRHYESISLSSSSLVGKVILVVDHGSAHAAYWLESRGCAIVFAGPHQKADDVLANDVGMFLPTPTVVVTADSELQQRCRRTVNGNGVYSDQLFSIVSPTRFLEELASAAMEDTMKYNKDDAISSSDLGDARPPHGATENVNGDEDDNVVLRELDQAIAAGKMDVEIKLGGQLLEAESMLQDDKRYLTNKRRKKLEKRVEIIREKLTARGPQVLQRVIALLGGGGGGLLSERSSGQPRREDPLWIRWQQIRNYKLRIEKTGDRVVLAERLRRYLVDSGEATKKIDDLGGGHIFNYGPAKMYVNYVNGYLDANAITKAVAERRALMKVPDGDGVDQNKNIQESVTNNMDATLRALKAQDPDEMRDELTVVVISDTHGYESQFADMDNGYTEGILPDGDVLLHLGDFTLDEPFVSPRAGWIDFDEFLAKQPHRFKIVLRGNHDPHRLNFAQSGAWYISKPANDVDVGGFNLALIPHGSSRVLAASQGLPSQCDLLASHVPPRNVLDLCLNGRNAGSGFLNRIVYSMSDPPRIWVCGHIHEGRGVHSQKFGTAKTTTTIVNAANANPGRASHLVHGPVVLRLRARNDCVEIVEMKNNLIEREEHFVGEEAHSIEMLLAVDLGHDNQNSHLWTASMFSSHGELVRFGELTSPSGDAALASSIELTIRSWQECVQMNPMLLNADIWNVTHVVVSGVPDGFQKDFTSVAPDRTLVEVDADTKDWRSAVLLPKELESSSSYSQAMGLAARQVVSDFGSRSNTLRRLDSSSASGSIVLGMYAMTRLFGWIHRADPIVRRNVNGGIVASKGFQ